MTWIKAVWKVIRVCVCSKIEIHVIIKDYWPISKEMTILSLWQDFNFVSVQKLWSGLILVFFFYYLLVFIAKFCPDICAVSAHVQKCISVWHAEGLKMSNTWTVWRRKKTPKHQHVGIIVLSMFMLCCHGNTPFPMTEARQPAKTSTAHLWHLKFKKPTYARTSLENRNRIEALPHPFQDRQEPTESSSSTTQKWLTGLKSQSSSLTHLLQKTTTIQKPPLQSSSIVGCVWIEKREIISLSNCKEWWLWSAGFTSDHIFIYGQMWSSCYAKRLNLSLSCQAISAWLREFNFSPFSTCAMHCTREKDMLSPEGASTTGNLQLSVQLWFFFFFKWVIE